VDDLFSDMFARVRDVCLKIFPRTEEGKNDARRVCSLPDTRKKKYFGKLRRYLRDKCEDIEDGRCSGDEDLDVFDEFLESEGSIDKLPADVSFPFLTLERRKKPFSFATKRVDARR